MNSESYHAKTINIHGGDLSRGNVPPLLADLGDIESKTILKKLTLAHRALAELKGVATGMPNQQISYQHPPFARSERFISN